MGFGREGVRRFGDSQVVSPARAAWYSSRSAAMAGPGVQREPQQLPVRDWGSQESSTFHGGHWHPDPHSSAQRDPDPQAPLSQHPKRDPKGFPSDPGILFPLPTPLKGPKHPVPPCSPFIRDPSVSPKRPEYLVHPLKGTQLFPQVTRASSSPTPQGHTGVPSPPTPKNPGALMSCLPQGTHVFPHPRPQGPSPPPRTHLSPQGDRSFLSRPKSPLSLCVSLRRGWGQRVAQCPGRPLCPKRDLGSHHTPPEATTAPGRPRAPRAPPGPPFHLTCPKGPPPS